MRYEALRVTIAAAMLAVGARGAAGQTIVVGAGGNLQAALNQAQPGQVVQLQAGATFDGNFVLPLKTGSGYITVRTSTPDAQLPGSTTRIDLSHEPLLATVRSTNAIPALRTAPGAHHWRLLGLRFTTTGGGDVITLGDAVERDRYTRPDRPDPRPHHDPRRPDEGAEARHRAQQRQHASSGTATSAASGWLGRRHRAIACWNGPGPFVIENNYIEAAGIGILFGGARAGHRSAGAERHRHPPQPHHAARRVARRELGREKSARAQERALRPDRRQPDREQLVGRTVGLRGRVHRARAEHVRAVDDDRTRPLREQRRPALGVGASTSSATTTRLPSQQAARPGHPQQPVHRHRSSRLGRRRHLPADRRRAGRRPRRAQHGDAQRQHHLGLRRHGRRAAGGARLPLRQQHRRAQHLRHLRQQRRHRQPGDRHLLPGQRDRRQRHRRRQPEPSTRPATCSRRWRT